MDTRFTEILVGLTALAFLLPLVADLFREETSGEKSSYMCQCYELVSDKSNYVCYLPSGEKDTNNECLGNKVYNDK